VREQQRVAGVRARKAEPWGPRGRLPAPGRSGDRRAGGMPPKSVRRGGSTAEVEGTNRGVAMGPSVDRRPLDDIPLARSATEEANRLCVTESAVDDAFGDTAC
jgi:hypothetical protein